MVLVSAFVELKVQLPSPLALVVEQEGVLFPVPETVIESALLAIGLPEASLRVIDTVDRSEPLAVTFVVALMVVATLDGEPATKVTFEGRPRSGVLRVTVLTSAFVEEKVHVPTPEAFVWPQLGVETPVEGVTVTSTDVLGTIFPLASLSVIVAVARLEPLAVRELGATAIVDAAATGAPGVKVRVGPVVVTTGVERLKVLDSALVELTLQ
jgi:hypothetical protein